MESKVKASASPAVNPLAVRVTEPFVEAFAVLGTSVVTGSAFAAIGVPIASPIATRPAETNIAARLSFGRLEVESVDESDDTNVIPFTGRQS